MKQILPGAVFIRRTPPTIRSTARLHLQKIQFSFLTISNRTGIAPIYSDSSTGGAVFNKSVSTNPSASLLFTTGRAGDGGTDSIDLCELANDLASRVITGRMDFIMGKDGGTKKVRVTGSFRLKEFLIY